MKATRTILLAALLIPALPARSRRRTVRKLAGPRADAGAHVRAHRRRVRLLGRSACARSTRCSPGATPPPTTAVAGLLQGCAGRRLAREPRHHRRHRPRPGRRGAQEPSRREAGRDACFPTARCRRASSSTPWASPTTTPSSFSTRSSATTRWRSELFVAGRGVDLSATDFWGRDAVDFARKNNNERLAQLILRSRPAAPKAQPAPQQPPFPS